MFFIEKMITHAYIFWAKFPKIVHFFQNCSISSFFEALAQNQFWISIYKYLKKLFLSSNLSCTIFAYVFYWKNDNPCLYFLGKIPKTRPFFSKMFNFKFFWSACTKSILDINLQILKETFSVFKFKLHNIRICFLLKKW